MEIFTEFTPENVKNTIVTLVAAIESLQKKMDFKERQWQKDMQTTMTIIEYKDAQDKAQASSILGEKILLQAEGKKAKKYRDTYGVLSNDFALLLQDHLSLEHICVEHNITDEVNVLLQEYYAKV